MLALAALVGCSSVREARETQEAVSPKGCDDRLVRLVLPARGEGSPAVAFALPDCVAFAMSNRPSVVAAKLAVDDARLALKQVAADAPLVSATPWTALNASVSGAWSETSEAVHSRDLDLHTDGDPSAGLSLELLVYDFGRNAAEARAQAERVVAAEKALVEQGYAVFEEVSSAAFACREKVALQGVAETNEQAFLLHLRQVENRLKEGEAKNLDVLRARLDHARACEELLVASNDVRTAFAEFRRALGVPAELVCPDADLWAALSTETLRFPYADPVSLARTNAPAMRIARARLRAASADVDRAVADLYPTVSASASLKWSDPLWVFGWGASTVQSLFQGFRKTTAVERATVALKQAEAAVDTAEQDLMKALELAMATRENAREAERAARKSLASAEENLALVAEQSRLGEASRVELADAMNAVAEARGSIATALCYGQQAEASLFALTGTAPVYVKPEETKK